MQVVRTAHSTDCGICVNVVVDAAHVSHIERDITRLFSLPGRYIASLKIAVPQDATEPVDAASAISGDAHRRVTRTVAAALCRGELSRLSTELRASAIGSRPAHLDMRGLAITNRLIEWLNEVQSSCAIPW